MLCQWVPHTRFVRFRKLPCEYWPGAAELAEGLTSKVRTRFCQARGIGAHVDVQSLVRVGSALRVFFAT
jgi:hypothetical protein